MSNFRVDRLVVIGLSVVLGLPMLTVIGQVQFDPQRLINFFPDDAFYYLQVAYNLGLSGAPSFDGVNRTTGFHPLQVVFSMPIVAIAGKLNALLVLFVFSSIAIALALIFQVRAVGLWGHPASLFAVLAALAPLNIHIIAASGMESALVVLISAVLFHELRAVAIEGRPSRFQGLEVGLAAALLILSRLDMVIPLLVIGLYFLGSRLQERAYGSIALAGLGSSVPVIGYLIWVWKEQGEIFPVSAVVKYGTERAEFSAILNTLTGNSLIGFVILCLIIVLPAAGLLAAGVLRSQRGRGLPAAVFVSGLVYIAYVLLVAHNPFRWYLAYPLGVATYALLYLLYAFRDALPQMRVSVWAALVLSVLIVNTAFMVRLAQIDTVASSLLDLTHVINEILPGGAILATHDAGIVGYFTSVPVHNLDGLANSLRNWEMFLRDRDMLGYARAHGVDHLLLRDAALPELYSAVRHYGISEEPEVLLTYPVLRMSDVTLLRLYGLTSHAD